MSHARMVELCEGTKYDTGRDLFALEALAAPSTFPEFHLLQLLLSSYISNLKDESKRKLALQQDDSIHITVENCVNAISISRQFGYASDPS